MALMKTLEGFTPTRKNGVGKEHGKYAVCIAQLVELGDVVFFPFGETNKMTVRSSLSYYATRSGFKVSLKTGKMDGVDEIGFSKNKFRNVAAIGYRCFGLTVFDAGKSTVSGGDFCNVLLELIKVGNDLGTLAGKCWCADCLHKNLCNEGCCWG